MRSRVVTTVALFTAAGALALSGCGSSGGGGGKSSGAGGLNTGGGSTQAPAPSSGGGAPSSGGLGGGGGKTYKIGFQGALSGDNKQLGINEVNAFNLAIKEANASGKYSFKIVGVTSDDGGDNNKSKAAAAKLIGDPAVVGVVGPIFSGPTSAAGSKYSDANMALISPSATNEDLTKSGFKTFHRIVPTDGIEGKATADYLAAKYKNVFVADDTTVYGKGVADVVAQELKAKNVKVERQGTNGATDSNLSPLATAVSSSGAKAIYFGGYDAEAALLAKALKAASFNGFEISGNGAKSTVFTQNSGAAGNGFYFACGCQDATTAPSAKAFNAAYNKEYGTPPSTYSPEGYDATNALITAIATAAKSGTVTRASVETAVNNLNYQGITTVVKFAPSGEVAQATVNLYEQKNGKITQLGDITKQ